MKKILFTIFLSLLLNLTTLVNAREIVENNEEHAWKINNKFIIPECLIYELYSGDNYEIFYETYFKKKADHNDIDFRSFIENIGMFGLLGLLEYVFLQNVILKYSPFSEEEIKYTIYNEMIKIINGTYVEK